MCLINPGNYVTYVQSVGFPGGVRLLVPRLSFFVLIVVLTTLVLFNASTLGVLCFTTLLLVGVLLRRWVRFSLVVLLQLLSFLVRSQLLFKHCTILGWHAHAGVYLVRRGLGHKRRWFRYGETACLPTIRSCCFSLKR